MLQVSKALRLLLNAAASRALPLAPCSHHDPLRRAVPSRQRLRHRTPDERRSAPPFASFTPTLSSAQTRPFSLCAFIYLPLLEPHLHLAVHPLRRRMLQRCPPPFPPCPFIHSHKHAPGADTLLFNDLFRYSPDKARASIAAGSSSTPPAQAWIRVTSGIHPPPRSSCAAAVFRNHMCV